MRIARIWGSRRIRQLAGRLLSLHQAEVRFDRLLDSVACIIATQWQRRRVVLLYGQLHCVCNRIRGFPSCLSGWEHLGFCPPARKAFPEVRRFRATHNSTFLCRVLMNYNRHCHDDPILGYRENSSTPFLQTVDSPERKTARATFPAIHDTTTESFVYFIFANSAEAQDTYAYFLYHKQLRW